jgi:hypothetical protein
MGSAASFCREYQPIGEDIEALIKLNVPVPSRDLVRVNLVRSHSAATNGETTLI